MDLRKLGEDAEGREKEKGPTSIEKTLGREGQAGILRRLDESCQYPKVNPVYSLLPSRTLSDVLEQHDRLAHPCSGMYRHNLICMSWPELYTSTLRYTYVGTEPKYLNSSSVFWALCVYV